MFVIIIIIFKETDIILQMKSFKVKKVTIQIKKT